MLEIPDLTTALFDRGFTLDTNDFPIVYSGYLNIHGEQISASITFNDSNLIDFPIIKLKERPRNLPEVCSHVLNDNIICYSLYGLSYIDRYSPIPSILGCIEKAEAVVESLISGDPFEDMAGEFVAYWDGNQFFIDIDEINEGFQSCWNVTVKLGDNELTIWSDDKDRLVNKYHHLNLELSEKMAGIYFIKSAKTPQYSGTQDWPPDNLSAFITWLKSFDVDSYKKLIIFIKDWFNYKNLSHFQVIFCNETNWYGIKVRPPKPNGFRNASTYKQAILNKFANSIKVVRFQPQRIDTDRLINRNLPAGVNNLIDKNIILIGCGTIGSYLSFVLARLGAGFGKGKFILIDKDVLSTGNLGRHRLGFRSLLKNKSEELKNEIKIECPGINIESFPFPGEKFTHYKEQDIIIDATATGSFSHWLNEQYLIDKNFPPILFTWILGNGSSAQAYLMDDRKLACLKCINIDDKNSDYSPLAQDYKRQISNGMGCDDPHVPFSNGASLSAVSLVEKLILEWASGIVKKRFRNCNLDLEHTKTIKPKDPLKWTQCPACNT